MIPLATAQNISWEKIDSLQPAFQDKVRAWSEACVKAGLLAPYIYEGTRSSGRQTQLYAIGRTVRKNEKPVTNAKAGQSFHQYGVAIDFVPLVFAKARGFWRADWSAKAYAPYLKIAAQHGLRRLSWERPHLEDASLKDWRAAAKLYPAA